MLIVDLPVEILLDHLLPTLSLSSLLALTCTCKVFADICQDQILWKRKLQEDYNFSATSQAARISGFKIIYKGIRHPRIFVWGNTGQSRLGLGATPAHIRPGSSGIPFPVELPIKTRIVSIVGGGWSFHALDDKGDIYAWGQLDGEGFALRSDGFNEPAKPAPVPHKLQLPARIREVTCGRGHAAALDANHRVWVFTNWGRPCLLTSPVINSRQDQIVQVECGWGFVSMLTQNGSVYVIWPLAGDFHRLNQARNNSLNEEGGHKVRAKDGVIPCTPIDIEAEPLPLPELPEDLPILSARSTTYQTSNSPKLVRIAAGDKFIIGLTNFGHVVCIDITVGEGSVELSHLRNSFVRKTRTWIYLPEFSDINLIQKAPVFSNTSSSGETLSGLPKVQAPSDLRITHISAHFNSFTAYAPASSSVVLMGTKSDLPATQSIGFNQDISASLQNRGVMSVVLGDYHRGALTSEGSLLTWGQFSDGALGLGDPRELDVGAPGGFATEYDKELASGRSSVRPPDVTTPTEVRFDWNGESKRSFCFAAAAAGWHTAALVVDLDGREAMYSDRSEEKDPKPPGGYPDTTRGPPYQLPRGPFDPPTEQSPYVPIRPIGGPFRIGLAGGMGRGLNPSGQRGRPADGGGRSSE